MKKIMLLSFLIASLSSCITMTSVTVSDVKPGMSNQVTAKSDGVGFLYLTVPRNLGEKAAIELSHKGAVSNITTTTTKRDWWIIQYYRVVAKGNKSN